MIHRGRGRISSGASMGKSSTQLHSIAGVLKDRAFAGSFEGGGQQFGFVYAPSKASIAGHRLLLEGRLTVTDARGNQRSSERVRALLAAVQGGLGAAPPRPGIAGAAPGRGEPVRLPAGLPQTESTGSSSFTGVMYFLLDRLDSASLRVSADLSRVQLNVRLAPADSNGRALHGCYSAVVDALYTEKPDAAAAQALVSELNRLLLT